MNISKNDSVMLTKEIPNVNVLQVGETYEVANINENNVVIRDSKSKVAVCSIDIEDFEKYFSNTVGNKWTNWCAITSKSGEVFASYKTNFRKVKVKIHIDEEHSMVAESTCNKCDGFNLMFGINLAYERCAMKINNMISEDIDNEIEMLMNEKKRIDGENRARKDYIKRMIKSIE